MLSERVWWGDFALEMLLRAGLSQVIKRGALDVITAQGRRLAFGDGTGREKKSPSVLRILAPSVN